MATDKDAAFNTAAADLLAEPPIVDIPPRRKRTPKPAAITAGPAAAPADAQAPTEGQGIGIPPEQIRMAMAPFLKSLARITKTSEPATEEIDGISTNLSFGLGKTKFGASATSGPWTPLLISLSLYAIPRAIEGVMAYAERIAEREEKERARKGQTFRAIESASEAASLATTGEGAGGEGPVTARGARTD